MSSLWDRLLSWYSKKGISTEQFFGHNSTEMGRDEMLMDFTTRMLDKEMPQGQPHFATWYAEDIREGIREGILDEDEVVNYFKRFKK